jgi:hypothetical protein
MASVMKGEGLERGGLQRPFWPGTPDVPPEKLL